MKLYADYLKEREGMNLIVSEAGFISYCVLDSQLFIGDLYVDQAARRSGEGKALIKEVEKIALESGCSFIFGIVRMTALQANEVLKIFLLNGAEVFKVEGQNIFVRREIK